MSPRNVGKSSSSTPEGHRVTTGTDPDEDENDPHTDVGWFGGDDDEEDKPTVVMRAGAEIEALWEAFSAKEDQRRPSLEVPSNECILDPITLSKSDRDKDHWHDLPEDAWLGVAAACVGFALVLLLTSALL